MKPNWVCKLSNEIILRCATSYFLDDMKIFIAIAGIHSIAFLIVTFQLFLTKPTSLKVMIPIVLVTVTAFMLLIAIDFFIEFHLMHVPPKEQYKSSEKVPKNESDGKKKGKGFKMGFFIIYVNMCIVSWFLYLAYKDLEEEIEKEEYESQPIEIIISHIT